MEGVVTGGRGKGEWGGEIRTGAHIIVTYEKSSLLPLPSPRPLPPKPPSQSFLEPSLSSLIFKGDCLVPAPQLSAIRNRNFCFWVSCLGGRKMCASRQSHNWIEMLEINWKWLAVLSVDPKIGSNETLLTQKPLRTQLCHNILCLK